MYQDNQTGEIDRAKLDELISVNQIKMFMRSDGWAIIGLDPLRGSGGMYSGTDRRGLFGPTSNYAYKIIT